MIRRQLKQSRNGKGLAGFDGLSWFIGSLPGRSDSLLMKTLLIASIASFASSLAFGQPVAPAVVERGPNHRVWQRTITSVLPNGRVAERKSSYTELATGLHYWKDGQWAESKEEIEIFQGAAAARQGPHQVIFAANLHSPGAIDLLTPDGKRFRSHILGLAYTDYATGQSVLIAETKDCQGAVVRPNQLIYQDAFAGDCHADVRYTYTKGAFEQDIILMTAPPSPAAWNFNPFAITQRSRRGCHTGAQFLDSVL